MSKKPKQSRHRVPPDYVRPADPIDERYQAEIDRSVSRLTKRYEAAERRLKQLEVKAERAEENAKNLAAAKAASEAVAANRIENERLLTERIATIKAAAKTARVEAARVRLQKQHDSVVAERNRISQQRKLEAKLPETVKNRSVGPGSRSLDYRNRSKNADENYVKSKG